MNFFQIDFGFAHLILVINFHIDEKQGISNFLQVDALIATLHLVLGDVMQLGLFCHLSYYQHALHNLSLP